MRTASFGLLAAASLSFGSGCTGGDTVTNPQDIVFPDSVVSYRSHVQPFLTLRCGQCHGTTNAAGGIRLTQYSYLFFDRPNLVVPTRPDESLLNQVLELRVSHPVGNINLISSNQVLGMRTWVAEGAANN
ncbi:MAG: hypothetical protein EHM43_05130 [Ignavibacteriae bacterium]|nr:MAG: hypothetical protein EHM43_05130 [Ignavibacteriota bacterium]